jgi:hypothetical protein
MSYCGLRTNCGLQTHYGLPTRRYCGLRTNYISYGPTADCG